MNDARQAKRIQRSFSETFGKYGTQIALDLLSLGKATLTNPDNSPDVSAIYDRYVSNFSKMRAEMGDASAAQISTTLDSLIGQLETTEVERIARIQNRQLKSKADKPGFVNLKKYLETRIQKPYIPIVEARINTVREQQEDSVLAKHSRELYSGRVIRYDDTPEVMSEVDAIINSSGFNVGNIPVIKYGRDQLGDALSTLIRKMGVVDPKKAKETLFVAINGRSDNVCNYFGSVTSGFAVVKGHEDVARTEIKRILGEEAFVNPNTPRKARQPKQKVEKLDSMNLRKYLEERVQSSHVKQIEARINTVREQQEDSVLAKHSRELYSGRVIRYDDTPEVRAEIGYIIDSSGFNIKGNISFAKYEKDKLGDPLSRFIKRIGTKDSARSKNKIISILEERSEAICGYFAHVNGGFAVVREHEEEAEKEMRRLLAEDISAPTITKRSIKLNSPQIPREKCLTIEEILSGEKLGGPRFAKARKAVYDQTDTNSVLSSNYISGRGGKKIYVNEPHVLDEIVKIAREATVRKERGYRHRDSSESHRKKESGGMPIGLTLTQLVGVGNKDFYNIVKEAIERGDRGAKEIFQECGNGFSARPGKDSEAYAFVEILYGGTKKISTFDNRSPIDARTLANTISPENENEVYRRLLGEVRGGNKKLAPHFKKEKGEYVVVEGHEQVAEEAARAVLGFGLERKLTPRSQEINYKPTVATADRPYVTTTKPKVETIRRPIIAPKPDVPQKPEIPTINFNQYFPNVPESDPRIGSFRRMISIMRAGNHPVLKRYSTQKNGETAYMDNSEVRKVIDSVAKKYGLSPSAENLTNQDNVTIITSSEQTDLESIANSAEEIKETQVPDKNNGYTVVSKTVVRELKTDRKRTHMPPLRIQDELHIPGIFLAQPDNRTLLGRPEDFAGGIGGYKLGNVANVLDKWIGTPGEEYRHSHPIIATPSSGKPQKEKEKEDKWVPLSGIAEEAGVRMRTVMKYAERFGNPTRKRTSAGIQTLYSLNTALRILDKLQDAGIITATDVVEEE